MHCYWKVSKVAACLTAISVVALVILLVFSDVSDSRGRAKIKSNGEKVEKYFSIEKFVEKRKSVDEIVAEMKKSNEAVRSGGDPMLLAVSSGRPFEKVPYYSLKMEYDTHHLRFDQVLFKFSISADAEKKKLYVPLSFNSYAAILLSYDSIEGEKRFTKTITVDDKRTYYSISVTTPSNKVEVDERDVVAEIQFSDVTMVDGLHEGKTKIHLYARVGVAPKISPSHFKRGVFHDLGEVEITLYPQLGFAGIYGDDLDEILVKSVIVGSVLFLIFLLPLIIRRRVNQRA